MVGDNEDVLVDTNAHLEFLSGLGAVQIDEDAEPMKLETGVDPGEVVRRMRGIPEVAIALKMSARAPEVEVADKDGFGNAGECLALVKRGIKAGEKFKKDGRAPITAELKKFDDACKEVLTELQTGSATLSGAIIDWQQAEEVLYAQLRQEASLATEALQKQLAESAAAAGLPEPPQVSIYIGPPPATIKTASGSTTVGKRWTYEVEKEEEVPREYCVPSPGKLMAAVNAGVRHIPGVRIYEGNNVSSKGA